MNAIQFIKDHGVEKAREVVGGAPETATHFELTIDGVFYFKFEKFDWLCFGDNQLINTYMEDHESYLLISLEDLKRLVVSVERINSCGGLHGFKTYCNGDYSQEDLQAIADYEAIYSNDIKIEVSFGVSLMSPERIACVDLTPSPKFDCETLDFPEDYTPPNCKKINFEQVK